MTEHTCTPQESTGGRVLVLEMGDGNGWQRCIIVTELCALEKKTKQTPLK